MSGLFQRRSLAVCRQAETDILMCLGAIDSEDRTVAGLQAILGITAVEGAVITFVTILTHDVTSVRKILLFTTCNRHNRHGSQQDDTGCYDSFHK